MTLIMEGNFLTELGAVAIPIIFATGVIVANRGFGIAETGATGEW
jgi:hypothetical protein